MVVWVVVGGGLSAAVMLTLWLWRREDRRADLSLSTRLIRTQPSAPECFDPGQVDSLPDAARRYFQFCIQPGAPLYTVARIAMTGKFGMGDKNDPAYMPMQAEQTLASPEGFVWQMQARKGWMHLAGSDSQSWTRFWLAGLVPVARGGGDPDHRRSAFGRYVAEAVFWTPAALLPGPGVAWEQVDTSTARVTVTYQDLAQQVDINLGEDGRPVSVSFQRWSNANPEKQYRLQPFGGYLSAHRKFAGFTLPAHVEAGNLFGTELYFPFFVVDITELEFPQPISQ